MKQIHKSTIAEVLTYILSSEEWHFEETLDSFGEDHPATQNHIYNKARALWAELEMDFSNPVTLEITGQI